MKKSIKNFAAYSCMTLLFLGSVKFLQANFQVTRNDETLESYHIGGIDFVPEGSIQVNSFDDILNPESVKKLVIFRMNEWTTLPDSIGRFTNLEELEVVSGTPLERLPDELWQLGNLRSFVLKDTRLEALPTEIERLTLLENLDVSFNDRLHSIPLSLRNLNNLLSFQSNPYNMMPNLITEYEYVLINDEAKKEEIRQALDQGEIEGQEINEMARDILESVLYKINEGDELRQKLTELHTKLQTYQTMSQEERDALLAQYGINEEYIRANVL